MTPISDKDGSYWPPSISSDLSLKQTESTPSKMSSCAEQIFLEQKDPRLVSSKTPPQAKRRKKKVTMALQEADLDTSTSNSPSLSIVGSVSVARPVTRSNALLSKNLLNSIKKNDIDAVRGLISAGANVNYCEAYGVTPLMHAADLRNGEDMVQLLLQKGAVVDQTDEGGRTALLWGVYRSDGVVKILLDAGASINHPDNAGRVALMAAAESGSDFSVNLLLQRGAEIDKRDLSGNTALMIAANQDCDDTTKSVQLLLESGPDIRIANDLGETALTLSKTLRDDNDRHLRYSTNFNSIQTAIISDKLSNEESLSDSEKEFLDSQNYNKKLAENRFKAFTRKRTLAQTNSQASAQVSALSEPSEEAQDDVKKIRSK